VGAGDGVLRGPIGVIGDAGGAPENEGDGLCPVGVITAGIGKCVGGEGNDASEASELEDRTLRSEGCEGSTDISCPVTEGGRLR
jgi:hypothetical protein